MLAAQGRRASDVEQVMDVAAGNGAPPLDGRSNIGASP